MNSLKSAALIGAALYLLSPTVAFAQVPDSQSPKSIFKAEQRTAEIESTRSDISDLSKFEHDHEHLPKTIYKRNYVDKHEDNAMIAGQPKLQGVAEHQL